MHSLIKFYFQLADTKVNVKMEPSMIYPLARMGNISLSCRNNQNNDPSQEEQGKKQGWCLMAKFVPWLGPFWL